MDLNEARSVLRSYLDDTDGADLDVDEYAAEVEDTVPEDRSDWSEVDEAIYVITHQPPAH
jgi:hypothetical protein